MLSSPAQSYLCKVLVPCLLGQAPALPLQPRRIPSALRTVTATLLHMNILLPPVTIYRISNPPIPQPSPIILMHPFPLFSPSSAKRMTPSCATTSSRGIVSMFQPSNRSGKMHHRSNFLGRELGRRLCSLLALRWAKPGCKSLAC